MKDMKPELRLRRLGIDTYKEAVVYLRNNDPVCISEGFQAETRVRVTSGERSIIAIINMIHSPLLEDGYAGLSEHAWELLEAKHDDTVTISHPEPLHSLSFVRSKIYGHALEEEEIFRVIKDITEDRYSDVHIASFLTACAGGRLNLQEMEYLTKAMVKVGDLLRWDAPMVVDKHCVGGLPGNRTTPIVVPIVAAFGLTMPKTSSRAITSPAGTADTMEVLAPVELDVAAMQKVVEREQGCIVWGGAVSLSPADDILIRVARSIELDGEGQLVASVLSKKMAAGSTHVLIDIPVGPTAKIRSKETANLLQSYLQTIGARLGLTVKVFCSNGIQPVGHGIGPALEARDIVAVLQGQKEAPQDLREHALVLAGTILEFSPKVATGQGTVLAREILDSGRAWQKFQAICETQGGMRNIPIAKHTHTITAEKSGILHHIDNRRLSKVAKLAGAPQDKAAGVDLHVSLGMTIHKGDPLFTIHSEASGELKYALSYIEEREEILRIDG